ncbi:MAG: bacillithiol biosynthesis BshC [Myxococcaceae bacterium]
MSAFWSAFLGGDPRALPFLPASFRDPAARAVAARQSLGRALAPGVASALDAQARRRAPGVARAEHLTRLAQGTAVAVVTGQQVGLFLGPLYSLFKAASAVVVARALTAETGVPCAPVFWLQSEDHDFAEIDHVTVHGREGALSRIQLASAHVPRASVSTIKLGAGVDAALASLRQALETLPHADEVVALFARHYRPDVTWVNAFAQVLAELFDELVIVDPRDEALARAVVPVHERAFAEREVLHRVLLEREAALEAAGFDVQVRARDVPLSFVHPEGRDGPRHRGARPSSEDPLCWSSSALLRPIIQDTLFPTAAIVGGPGELNYFAQLSPLYAHFGVPMPMVMPRARFRVVEPRARALLAELGLSAADVEVSREALLRRVAAPRTGETTGTTLEQQLLDGVLPVLEHLEPHPGLERSLERTRRAFTRTAQRFAARYERARLERDAVAVARVDRLQRALFPSGVPQERVLGLAGFAARIGVKEFVAQVLAGVTPFGADVKELS